MTSTTTDMTSTTTEMTSSSTEKPQGTYSNYLIIKLHMGTEKPHG
jgi:hypothetical protein